MWVMFTALTGVEDQGYYPTDPKVIDAVLAHRNDAVLATLAQWFEDDYKLSLFDELKSQQNIRHALLSRVAQAYLFLGIAHVLNKRYGTAITGYGGYCGGIMSALYGSGALGLEVYRGALRRPLERLLQVMARSIVTHDFVSSIFDFSDTGWTLDEVGADLTDFGEEVHVKDVRGPHVFELIAARPVLERYVVRIHRLHGSCVRNSRYLQDTFAHTPHVQPNRFRGLFAEFPLAAPAHDIFSSRGRVWRAGDTVADLRALYLETLLDPIRMADCAGALQARQGELVLVGHRPVARYIFSGMGARKPAYRLLDAPMLA